MELMKKGKIKIIALVGPTGMGKTEIGIALAEKLVIVWKGKKQQFPTQ